MIYHHLSSAGSQHPLGRSRLHSGQDTSSRQGRWVDDAVVCCTGAVNSRVHAVSRLQNHRLESCSHLFNSFHQPLCLPHVYGVKTEIVFWKKKKIWEVCLVPPFLVCWFVVIIYNNSLTAVRNQRITFTFVRPFSRVASCGATDRTITPRCLYFSCSPFRFLVLYSHWLHSVVENRSSPDEDVVQ